MPRIITDYYHFRIEAMFKDTSYFFSIKDIFVFVNNLIDLTGRNIDTELQKLFKDQRLRDIGMIILVQNIPDQIDVIVSLDMFRELACNILPGAGLPSLHAKTNIVWFEGLEQCNRHGP